MRIRLLLLILLAALTVAGCGSSSAGSSVDPSLLSELSYLPAGSPLVLTVATDPNSSAIKQAQALEGQFPIAAFGKAALNNKLQQVGINYAADVRPLFGNPVVLAAGGATLSGAAGNEFLLVWMTKDQNKLNALLKKLLPSARSGSLDGASLYTSGSYALAVSGSTVVFAANRSLLQAALQRHAQGGGISAAQYTRETAGLPHGSLVQVFGDLSGVLSTPSAAKARRVPWVAALRGYGAAIDAGSSGLSIRFHLDTSGAHLSASQLPIAGGSAAASLASSSPISTAVHDPAQIVQFAEAAEQETNPSGYQRFLTRQASLRAKTGVDITALAKLLTGDLIIGSDTHKTAARIGVSDPPAAANDLAKLATTPHGLFTHAEKITKLPGGFYAIKERRRTINVGVIGSQLVAGNVTPAQLRAYAAAPATPASGARGSVAFRVSLAQLLQVRLRSIPAPVQSIISRLGDITGWSSASPSGLDGEASLALR
ncbi:MAG: DUF3352 domain-containing protein [Actinomycetota bacterium]|nr:DUF3352 domain-containing protein [Actinomycetota bacterium]